MSEFTPSRRSVVRTAAWSLPVVSIAAAAPAFATSPPGGVVEYQNITRNFVFHPTFFGAPLTNIDILVDVEATIPLKIPAGMTANPTSTVSTVTIPGTLVGILRGNLGNPAEVGGTSISISNLTGALGNLDSTTNLVLDRTPFPAGDTNLVTIARGTGDTGLTPPVGSSGAITVTLAPPNSTLQGYNAAGAPVGSPYNSILAPKAGQDYTLGTITIV